MKLLHVACLPFPSPQGTQGLVGAQLRSLAKAGHEVHLLTYESGGDDRDSDSDGLFAHHRCGGRGIGLRSGPSGAKIIADIAMVQGVRAHCDALRPDVLFAHNVEAAWVAQTAQVSVPIVYVAHTRMDKELPTYFGPGLAKVAALAGGLLDHVASRADHTAAVSPLLADHLDATYLAPPWPLPPPITAEERREARDALGLQGVVAMYAGNLDGYQDWRQIFAARDFGITLVVATESNRDVLSNVDHVLPLRDEAERRRAHALADIALVPRGAEGGLPIKLIDALARGVPVAASHRALAGLSPGGAIAGRDIAAALQAMPKDFLSRGGEAGRAWVAKHADPQSFVEAMEGVCRIAIDKKARSVRKWR